MVLMKKMYIRKSFYVSSNQQTDEGQIDRSWIDGWTEYRKDLEIFWFY